MFGTRKRCVSNANAITHNNAHKTKKRAKASKQHEMMKIILSAFLSGALFATTVYGQNSLRANQALRSFPKHFVVPDLPFVEKDLEHRKLAISQQCIDDTLALYDSVEYSTAFDEWASERSAAGRECMANGSALECSVDSKTLASHNNLVSVCEAAGGLSYLYTYYASCDVTLGDTSSGIVTFNDIDIPECVASSCTLDEFGEVAASFATRLAEINEESLLGLTTIISATCTESDPIGTPTTPPDSEQQCLADINALYATPELSSVRDAWLTEFRAETAASCTGSCVYDSKDYPSHDGYLAACEQVGGISFLFTDSLRCRGSTSTTEYTLDIHLIDHPQCIPPSCDVNDHIERLNTILDDVGQSREEASQISNYECTSPDPITSGLPTSPAPFTSPPSSAPPTVPAPTPSELPAACGAQCTAEGRACYSFYTGVDCCCGTCSGGAINAKCQ